MEIISKPIFRRKSKTDRRKGKWVLRIKYFDTVADRLRCVERQFDSKNEAVDARPGLEADIKKTHGQIQTGEKMTFAMLTERCKSQFYKPAVIVEGRKIDGVRSYVTTHGFINTLNQYFGKKRLGQITVADLKAYKVWRLKQGSRRGKKEEFVSITLTTVNRELATMRRMMKHAFHEGWTVRDIFAGAKVIDIDAEMERVRQLTDEEEELLLASCQGTRQIAYKRKLNGKEELVTATIKLDNPHLKAIILLALDSAMRRGEILKLNWNDLNFDASVIEIKGTHTKTERSRTAPLTERTKAELVKLPSFGKGDAVFPFTEFKRSWNTAIDIAGIRNLHFHDLRRTSLTRMILDGVPLAVVGKIAGHARLETTMRHYISTNTDVIGDVTDRINARHTQQRTLAEANEFVN